MISVCDICKERYMCDRVLYSCPRGDDKPNGNTDELSTQEVKEWEELYSKPNVITASEVRRYF